MENQHRMIPGYRDLGETDIANIATIKKLEEHVAGVWLALSGDPRWRSIARTHFQEGFSALVRSIALPTDPFEG